MGNPSSAPLVQPAANQQSILAAVSTLIGVFAVYLFLSGWTFFDYYYRLFGLNPRWVEISLYDILVKGFTILFTGGVRLCIPYVAAIAGPLLCEFTALKNKRGVPVLLAIYLLLLLAPVYLFARQAGEREARIDRGEHSRLVTVSFIVRNLQYRGRLLYFKNGMYFIHGAHTPKEKTSGLELSIYRTDEVSETTVVGFE